MRCRKSAASQLIVSAHQLSPEIQNELSVRKRNERLINKKVNTVLDYYQYNHMKLQRVIDKQYVFKDNQVFILEHETLFQKKPTWEKAKIEENSLFDFIEFSKYFFFSTEIGMFIIGGEILTETKDDKVSIDLTSNIWFYHKDEIYLQTSLKRFRINHTVHYC